MKEPSSSPYGGNDALAPNFSSYNLATDFMATDAEVAEAIHRLHGGVGMTSSMENKKPEVVNKTVKGGSNEDLKVLIKGDNVFGTTVSKSFDRVNSNGNREVDTVNISVASYRVVEVRLLLALYMIVMNGYFIQESLTALFITRFVPTISVQEIWQVRTIPRDLPRGRYPRHNWSLEAIFRL